MRALRALVRDFNSYGWAGRTLIDAAGLRQRERISERFGSHDRPPLRKAV